jgi:hypothetical protein
MHMHHNLLAFAFFAILLGVGYQVAFGHIYRDYFSASLAFQTYWYVPFLIIPGLLQIALGWWIGFWRWKSLSWLDGAAAVIVVAIAYLTLDASYSCGSGCF